MINVQTLVDIGRPAAEVFAFVSDQTNAPQWQDGLEEVRRTSPGPIGVGSEHVFVRVFAGRRIESRNRFIAYDEPALFVEFEIPDGPITGVASYRVEPLGADASRVISTMNFRATGVMRWFSPLLTRVMRRDSRRDDIRLKSVLERCYGPSDQARQVDRSEPQ